MNKQRLFHIHVITLQQEDLVSVNTPQSSPTTAIEVSSKIAMNP